MALTTRSMSKKKQEAQIEPELVVENKDEPNKEKVEYEVVVVGEKDAFIPRLALKRK